MAETVTDDSGKALLVRRIKRIGALFRTDTHNLKAATDSSRGFTGRLFWYSDQNGFTVPIIGNPAKVMLAEDLLFTDGLAELPWTNIRSENRWNKTLSVARVEQDAAAPVDLYIDPDTGAYAGAVIDPKGDNEEVVRILDYQLVGGKHFVGRWKYDGAKSTTTVSDIKLGAHLTGEDLHPPAQSAHWEFKDKTPFPLRLTAERVIIKARVNGVEGTFLLDSGAASIFLSGAFARRAGLKAIGHSESSTLYAREKTDVGKIDTLEIGGNTLHDATVYFGPGEIEDKAPDGLMGFDLLAGAFVTIDFEKATLQIRDAGTVDALNIPGVRIGVDLSLGIPVTTMYVQGKTTTVNAILDTGSPRAVLISRDLPKTYGLHLASAGVFGGCGTLDNMTLGPIVYDKPSACTTNFDLHEALLGYDFLKGLSKLHFDYGRATMILTPRSK